MAVGDTSYDAEAAGTAGVSTVAVLSGGFPGKALREANCIVVYRRLYHLLAGFSASPLAGRGTS
jgi:phosphoglycolate phosphatase-like HAD superfamily hydrolase